MQFLYLANIHCSSSGLDQLFGGASKGVDIRERLEMGMTVRSCIGLTRNTLPRLD